jgi:hypothetical protein
MPAATVSDAATGCELVIPLVEINAWAAAWLTSGLAIIGGILAIGKIAIDKIRELEAPYGTVALSVLASAIIPGIGGPFRGSSVRTPHADVYKSSKRELHRRCLRPRWCLPC